jgi:nucleoside-diphosphate-sugar epimerase
MDVTTVAISGASGLVGVRPAAELASRDDGDRVVGLDFRDPPRRSRFEFHRVDIASADLKLILEDADVIVHLASVVDPIPDEAFMQRVNVAGTHRVLEAAGGARQVIRVSPTSVYGAWANNPVPLTEAAPLRPNPGFSPAVHAGEVERALAQWSGDHPGVSVTTLRAAPVVGPGADTLTSRLLLARPPLRVRDAAPPVQALHVDDLVNALVFTITESLTGTYNVAPDGWLSAEEAMALVGRTAVPPLPAEVLERALTRTWTSGVGEIPPGIVPYLTHPWVVANDRLRSTGWVPEHSNEEAIVEGLEALDTRSHSKLALALALGGAAVAAGAAAGAILRRRSRRS